MTIVSAHQPAYLPWLGFFHKIMLSDVFVILDAVQFEKNSFTNRNKIKGANGDFWLSVPLGQKGHLGKTIRNMKIDNGSNWKAKHLKSLESAYRTTKYFNDYSDFFRDAYSRDWDGLAQLNDFMLGGFLKILGVETKLCRMSDYGFHQRKDGLVLEICEKFNAEIYISGTLGKDYLDVCKFKERGIEVYFQEYNHPRYAQPFGDFIPNLGVADLIFNHGPQAAEVIGHGNISKADIIQKYGYKQFSR